MPTHASTNRSVMIAQNPLLAAFFSLHTRALNPGMFIFFFLFLFMLLIRELSNGAKHCLDFLVGRVFRDFSFLCNCRENKSCLTVCSEQHVCHWLCGGAPSSSVFNLWGMTFVNTPSRICEACWLSRPSGCSSAAWHAEMTNWQSDSLRWKNTNKKSLWHLHNER